MDKTLVISLIILSLVLGIGLGVLLNTLTTTPEAIVEKEVIKEYVDKPYLVMTSLDAEEIIILSKIVEAEATGGTIPQKINVAHAILNRVQSKKYPNTVKEVVFQKNQFSPISDKRYWQVNVSDDTIKAVTQALDTFEVHSNSIMWFMNEKHSSEKNVKWFKSNLNYMYDDGLHQYYGEK